MEIESGKDITYNKSHILLIGPAKTGKTRMLGTASLHEKLFIISMERGLTTISGGDFDFKECATYEDFKEAFNWFMSNYKEKGYTALGIDSITRLQRYVNEHIMQRDSLDKLGFDGFAEMLAIMRKIADVVTKQTDFASIVTCHQDQSISNANHWPLLEGAFKFEVEGYFDSVALCKKAADAKGNPAYWCEINGAGLANTGTRLSHLKGLKTIPNHYQHLIKEK